MARSLSIDDSAYMRSKLFKDLAISMGEIIEGKRVEVLGIIIPANWDSHGGVTDIAISAFDESEYLIERTEMSVLLRSFLHQQVKVKGCLLPSAETDRPVIRVEEFSPAKAFIRTRTELQ